MALLWITSISASRNQLEHERNLPTQWLDFARGISQSNGEALCVARQGRDTDFNFLNMHTCACTLSCVGATEALTEIMLTHTHTQVEGSPWQRAPCVSYCWRWVLKPRRFVHVPFYQRDTHTLAKLFPQIHTLRNSHSMDECLNQSLSHRERERERVMHWAFTLTAFLQEIWWFMSSCMSISFNNGLNHITNNI